MIKTKNLISIVISYYNSHETSEELIERLKKVIQNNSIVNFEIIIIDDGSDQFDLKTIVHVSTSANFHLKVVQLDKNYGQVTAILTGLHYSTGDAVIIMSSDLQDPPELIPQMIEKWENSKNEVVACVRSNRKDKTFRKIGAALWYQVVLKKINPNYPKKGSDFALINRRVVDLLNTNKSTIRFIQNEILINSNQSEFIEYKREATRKRNSEWNLLKISKLMLDIIFTHLSPLRILLQLNSFILVALISFSLLFYFTKFDLFNLVTLILFCSSILINLFFLSYLMGLRKRQALKFNPTLISKVLFSQII